MLKCNDCGTELINEAVESPIGWICMRCFSKAIYWDGAGHTELKCAASDGQVNIPAFTVESTVIDYPDWPDFVDKDARL